MDLCHCVTRVTAISSVVAGHIHNYTLHLISHIAHSTYTNPILTINCQEINVIACGK